MKIDLAGVWTLALDPMDRGIVERWWATFLPHPTGKLHLPGSLQAQGFGDEITLDTPWTGSIVDRSFFEDARYAPYRRSGAIKVPFWLQPERYYKGAAWYQRTVRIPEEWRGHRLVLRLERPHWQTHVWLDEQPFGCCDSLATAHVYELGCNVAPGEHRLTVRVDNRMIVDVGPNAHSVSDHTQSNWNGIVGGIELCAESPVWLRRVRIFPRVAERSALVKIDIASVLGRSVQGRVSASARLVNTDTERSLPPVEADVHFSAQDGLEHSAAGGHIDLLYPLGEDALTWDEFQPALYELTVDLEMRVSGDDAVWRDRRVLRFGLREVGVQGTQITLNGHPIFLRGTLECCIFPLTGYPPTDVESWRRILRVCKAHGLNHMRFHSWCPPEAAFVAADEMGFYYQVECPVWANQGAAIGEGRPLDVWLFQEGWRILDAYGNHPSFLLMAYGNEPAGRFEEYLAEWVTYWRKRDPRRLYTGGAGWPIIEENQYHNTPIPRIQQWGAGLSSRINAQPPETITDYRAFVEQAGAPVISHEIGQWCVYPNFDEIAKYTGTLKPKNFEIFRDFLVANHMGDQAKDFLLASGKLQALCYKEEIESALRTPGFGGFQLLDLHDFPGQGTALVGVLDPFWEEKGYITAEQFRRFCNSTVPLARMQKRYWRTDETFQAKVQLFHFGPTPIVDTVLEWRFLSEDGTTQSGGKLFLPGRIEASSQPIVEEIRCALADFLPARKYTLILTLDAGEERFENDWDVWIFAPRLELPTLSQTVIASSIDEALHKLQAEGRALLLLDPAQVNTSSQIGFSSVFWNTAWTRGQPPHTLGILCNPAHPVFADFPTEYHSNWQWWELIHGAAAMQIDHLPPTLRPLVQPIDTWFEARRLALLFEARLGSGRLMVCSMDLHTNLNERLVARQFLYSVLRYMEGGAFAPSIAIEEAQLRSLVKM
ncbi:sugar-binding domain-containing protein [Caldilinea sp.]|uniref:sugar-binding domain-containing protein n=1 Tax=Caldilinea sp. TaxID=2293560 RepID=UPI001B257584|nr:sugar-binding domain-containing protein [Caldilinea sp.]MBO9394230.1 glycoside hydrolase [Caldilinea sp.]